MAICLQSLIHAFMRLQFAFINKWLGQDCQMGPFSPDLLLPTPTPGRQIGSVFFSLFDTEWFGHHLADWIQRIPRNPTRSYASSQGRIEDGGSLSSTAVWAVPQHHDILRALRFKWHQRLLTNHLCRDITSSLNHVSADPPLSNHMLSLFLSDIKQVFGNQRHRLATDAGGPVRATVWLELVEISPSAMA